MTIVFIFEFAVPLLTSRSPGVQQFDDMSSILDEGLLKDTSTKSGPCSQNASPDYHHALVCCLFLCSVLCCLMSLVVRGMLTGSSVGVVFCNAAGSF
jgi:hypothetical protein